MFDELLKRFKSRTNITALVIGVLGVIEANIHMLQDLLGKWYGLTFVVVAVIMMILREITTEPVTEK